MNNLIKKITIENFRSIKRQTLECHAVNIFAGLNDVGKSNILKALNLYFNGRTDFQSTLKFENDFNKIAYAEAQRASKKKQLIKIRVYFNPPSNFRILQQEKEVYLERIFDKNNFVNQSFSSENHKTISQITRLFNRIKFIYIPALKGHDVLQAFLGQLGELELISSEEVKNLNSKINQNVSGLITILGRSSLEFEASFRLPIFLQDFWQSLSVQTTYDNFNDLDLQVKETKKGKRAPLNVEFYQIPLLLRGEGIKSKFIPALLKWLENLSSYYFIWGIDEPENSLEFRKCQELADIFYNYYANETQIFATSHSLAFIFPNENVQNAPKVFRCLKGSLGETQIITLGGIFETEDRLLIQEEIGVLEIQKEIMQLFREKVAQLNLINNQLQTITKPLVFFEGSTDKKIVELAFERTRPQLVDFEIFETDSLMNPDGTKNSDIGTGASKLNEFLFNYAAKVHTTRKIVGIFDYDEEGITQFNGLIKRKIYRLVKDSNQIKIAEHHVNRNIKAMLLPVPSSRQSFTDKDEPNYCHFSIELYFDDSVINENQRFYPYKADKSVFRFKGDKGKFYQNILNHQNRIDFCNFSADYFAKCDPPISLIV